MSVLVQVLYIIPHRELCCIPFGSLQSADDEFVVERYAVLISPTIFDQHRPAAAAADDALVSASGRGIFGKNAQQLTLVTGAKATVRPAFVEVGRLCYRELRPMLMFLLVVGIYLCMYLKAFVPVDVG